MPLFTPSEKQFIELNIDQNVENLLLKTSKSQPENIKLLAEQIKARQKIKEKLPAWYKNFNFLLPKSISVEQSSSEITAKYKAKLVEGCQLVDMTGGMGIDFFEMAKKFKTATYIEENAELNEIAEHNAIQLGLKNVQFLNENSVDFLKRQTDKYDWIYLDPARRNQKGGKVVSLTDCEPNILEIKELLLEKSDKILLKCSPMLDIDLAISQLKTVAEIHVVSVENEVKELLFLLNKNICNSPVIQIIHFKNEDLYEFQFDLSEEKNLEHKIGAVQKFLYEPHVGILKAGAFKTVCQKYDVTKLHPNTHLYTSERRVIGFPGREFEVVNILKPDKKEILKALPEPKANITVRNFPETVEILRKKFAIKDGGNHYLFACTNNFNQKIILQTVKIN